VDPSQQYTFESNVFLNPVIFNYSKFPLVDAFFSGGEILPGEGITLSATGLTGPLDLVIVSPEPSTLPLLLVGLVPIVWFGRKFRGSVHPI
jgi:hypothetical protein